MKLFMVFLAILMICSCSRPSEVPTKPRPAEGDAAETQYKKELEEIRKGIKGEVKIKLKKDGKGSYSWEISGKDAQEVLKANETLRKKLSD
jgi:hypothetical protein